MVDTEITKICTGCDRELPVADFWRDRYRPDGKTSRCKVCMKTDHKAWLQKELDPAKKWSSWGDRSSEYKERRRQKRIGHLSPKNIRRRALNADPETGAIKRIKEREKYDSYKRDLKLFLGRQLKTLRQQAKQRGREFILTREDIIELYRKQTGRCPLSGRELLFGQGRRVPDTMSIDRIDNDKGYIPGNVRLLTFQANVARNIFSDDDLVSFCRDVVKVADVTLMMRP